MHSNFAFSPRPLLIIDDEEDAHVFLKRDLSKCGISHPIESVFGGEEAIAYLQECIAGERTFPVVVFLDVKMPGLTGLDVLAWVLEHEILGKVTLSMLSSSDDPKDVSRAMALGAHTYLTKPPPHVALTELVRTAVRLSERHSSAEK